MKIELVKSVEVNEKGDEKTWWIVRGDGGLLRYHHSESEAQKHYDGIKNHYTKFGTIAPQQETILSEEIIPNS
jgi:hypothetical protein